MDFQSMMETFAEAWVAANTQTPLTEAAAAAAATDHTNLFMGLSGTGGSSGSNVAGPNQSPMDISGGGGSGTSAAESALNRRLSAGLGSVQNNTTAPSASATTTSSTSANQSPGLNLSSHPHATTPDVDESLSSVAFNASHLIDIKDVIGGSNNARNTLPIHCIIERVNASSTSSGSLISPGHSSGTSSGSCQASSTPPLNTTGVSTSASSDLSMTISSSSSTAAAATTQATNSTGPAASGSVINANPAAGSVIEQDTYAILPSTIPFNDIVRAVLTKLGYASQEMVGAKAFVQLRNWKPLTLDQISESVELTIGDIFGDICSFITLRIRLCRPRMSAAHELKDKLLQVLLAHSYSLLTTNSTAGSSIDQQILSSLIRGRDQQQELNEDARRRFDQWYLQQVFNQYRQFAFAAQQHSVSVSGLRSSNPSPGAASSNHPLFMDINNLANGNDSTLAAAAAAGLHPSLAAAAAAAAASAVARPNAANGNIGPSNSCTSGQEKSYSSHKQSNNSNNQNSSSGHHHSSSMTSSRTRIRTSFDPELELPKLHKWFSENRHPSRSQVQEYVKELNSLESRKGRKPLDVNNVVYWFKNARAAHKRAELKFVSNDSNISNHSPFGGFNPGNALTNEFFINGGNHSPGKASSEASISGKCNDEPMSNASRNGSNLDDYYSFDEDGDSHEETQTLDLSVRNPLCIPSKLNESPQLEIKTDDGDECDDLKFIDDCKRQELNDNNESLRLESDQLRIDQSIRNVDVNSDCNSIEDESEEENETNNNAFNTHTTTHNITNSLSTLNHNSSGSSQNPESPEGRRARRSRTFIDPMSEVPRLESWFMSNTHPAHSQIVRYTDELNKMPYRQKFPKLEPKNIQFWFKNRRAKIKRTSGLSSTMNLSAAAAAAAAAGSSTSSSTNNNLPNTSIHNSSALNIERLINAH